MIARALEPIPFLLPGEYIVSYMDKSQDVA